ncbi:hypothetical protein M9H77_22621 [Catharanthus roseus]|uniref:Uncharacterized protein n=1 Tax=Catharanthus roseus TaxID=4058 RepID=A0ACC0AQP6_CATRO|nr:hypothetical protein M9H77_22621 [Catharanthus roseus]
MPRKIIASTSLKRARIPDPSSPETDPFISPFLDRIPDKSSNVWFEESKIEPKRTIDPTLDNQLEISNHFTSLGWGRMISRSGVYYPSLVKEFYPNMTQKNNKDLIIVETIVKRVNITLDQTLFSHITSF